MANEYKSEGRDLRNGDWCWIHKAVIQQYTPRVGSTGIAIYSFLASLVDGSQRCFPSQKYIAQRLGYSRATISRTLKLLERNRLIKIEKRSRYHCIYHLLKVRCRANETQLPNRRNSDVKQMNTNNNKLTRNINNIDNEDKKFSNSNPLKGFKPKNREELLALDLANALDERKGLPLYLSYAKRYPESLLRRTLGEVKEIPSEKIKKSRAALFNYLVQKYAKEASKNPRD